MEQQRYNTPAGIAERGLPQSTPHCYSFKLLCNGEEFIFSMAEVTLSPVANPLAPQMLQAASGNSAQTNQAIVDVLFNFIDRMNDLCPEDPADKILGEFTEAVEPLILQSCETNREAINSGNSELLRYKKALVAIKIHQELVAGTIGKKGTTWNIASNALTHTD